MNKIKYTIFTLFIISIISCNDYLDIEPTGKVIPKTVNDYRNFLTSAYATPKNNNILTTYRADELQIKKTAQNIQQYDDIFIWNDENPNPQILSFEYANFYKTIFYTNHVVNNKNAIEGNLSSKEQLVGEAYALRALQYFSLVNLYSEPYNKTTSNSDNGVPIVTEYDAENTYPIQSLQKVYDLILNDLEQAEKLININQQEVGKNYRFSKIAVKSFKSRAFLYQQEWQKAIDVTNEALNIKSTLVDLNVDNSIMPSEYNSIESILALDLVSNLDIAANANVSNDLLNSYDKTNDLRFALYFNDNNDGSFSVIKNANDKYKCSFRTSELYLTKAEALTQLNKLTEAKTTLKAFLKTRYTTTGYNNLKTRVDSFNKSELLDEILNERRKEFAIEGHRWNDLRRTTQPKITKVYDGKTYTLNQNDSKYVIPIPVDAKINNPNL